MGRAHCMHMPDSGLTDHVDGLYRWFHTFLKDRGLQFSRCGFKLGDGLGSGHEIDLTTGFWARPSYSRNKPPRWLYNAEIDDHGQVSARSPTVGPTNIGQANTAQGDKAGLAVRVLPLIRASGGTFHRDDRLEAQALFVFGGPVPRGSSSESFIFDPDTGWMTYKDHVLPYELAALIGVRSRDELIDVPTQGQLNSVEPVPYGNVVDAIAQSIKVVRGNGQVEPIRVVDLSDESAAAEFKELVESRWRSWTTSEYSRSDDEETDELLVPEPKEVTANPDLIGVDATVYRQINAALKSGKRHLMFYGPPGTGKTTLARWVASCLAGDRWTLITGSADWSSQDIVGGY